MCKLWDDDQIAFQVQKDEWNCNGKAGTDMNEAETGNRKSWCHFNVRCNHFWSLDALEMSPWIYETAKIFYFDSVIYSSAWSLKIELYEAIMFWVSECQELALVFSHL